MQTADRNIIHSPAARQIQADCRALAEHFGLVLDHVGWAVSPPQSPMPYDLVIKVPGLYPRTELTFSREAILDYGTGASTAQVREALETALDALCQAVLDAVRV
jgi:hypothetical protein